jgi:lipopolysaccharide/colanic/teichoic acid biosynthesis glycosyltransferase
MYKHYIKIIFDFVISGLALFFISPFFILIIVFLFFSQKRSDIFYTQIRPGKHTKLFKIIKFKTMSDKKNELGDLLPDKDRLTKLGKLLRATSLDELPQLINVLRGEMSLVGPRPLLPKYLPLYNEKQAKRHEVKPGITGWTQVNGRNALSWKEKFELDVWYVENLSFALDMKILFLTLLKVIKREGINASDSVSGVPFTGNEE